MLPLTQTLAPWQNFYMLLGEAAATMTALLFVAASIGSGVFSQSRPAPLRIFLSATVVHFASILVASLIALAPIQRWELFGGLIVAFGIFGLIYSGLAWRDTVHDGLAAKIDWDDRIWYAVLPAVGYLFETGSGIVLAMRLELGCVALAVSVGVLLVVAIHNAWDITVWSVTRRKE